MEDFLVGDIVKIKKDITLDDLTQNSWNGCQISTMDFLKSASFNDFNAEYKIQRVGTNFIQVEGSKELVKEDIFELVRREPKEMIVEEICEALGYEVKVVK